MKPCPCHDLIERYHDGELSGPCHQEAEAHLHACPACADQLRQLRQISTILKSRPLAEISPSELTRLHALQATVQRQVGEWAILRIGMPLSALAATLLVATSLLLLARPTTAATAATAAGAKWELLASGANRAGGNSNVDLSGWMIRSLGGIGK